MQIKGYDVMHLSCKFGTDIFIRSRVIALSFFHSRKIPYLKECARVTLKGHQSKFVWYVHHHHRLVYQWHEIHSISCNEYCAIAWRKMFCRKTHFFVKNDFKCLYDLDLCTYQYNFSWRIRILYAPLYHITFVSSINSKAYVEAEIYGQYA